MKLLPLEIWECTTCGLVTARMMPISFTNGSRLANSVVQCSGCGTMLAWRKMVIFYNNAVKALWALACVLMAVGCGLMAYSSSERAVVGWLGAAFFAICGLFVLRAPTVATIRKQYGENQELIER
jgi:hypothetical protein